MDQESDEDRCANCITSAQLAECLQGMPSLRSLQLFFIRWLDSLVFLSTGSLPSTLTSLHLHRVDPRLPVREVEHIRRLRAAMSVTLHLVSTADSMRSSVRLSPSLPLSYRRCANLNAATSRQSRCAVRRSSCAQRGGCICLCMLQPLPSLLIHSFLHSHPLLHLL